VTLKVALVVPDRELWSGDARMVIAKTTEGDIGVLTGHAPVFGILAEGSMVEILDPGGSDQSQAESGGGPGSGSGEAIRAAVSGGFLSVADDQVSILAARAQLGAEIDVAQAQRELEESTSSGGQATAEEPAEAKYARAQLRAAGEQA
jgi:F-type H+-transporting ATPase subunit epsilon